MSRTSSSLHYTRAARTALGLGENETYYLPSHTMHGKLRDGTPVRMLPSKKLRGNKRGKGLMRLQIMCSSCRQWIPAGRFGQHKGSGACYAKWAGKTKTHGRDPKRRRFADLEPEEKGAFTIRKIMLIREKHGLAEAKEEAFNLGVAIGQRKDWTELRTVLTGLRARSQSFLAASVQRGAEASQHNPDYMRRSGKRHGRDPSKSRKGKRPKSDWMRFIMKHKHEPKFRKANGMLNLKAMSRAFRKGE